MKGAISMKKIAVIGLGLMGASIAKAYKKNGSYTIYAYDKDPSVLSFSKISETADETLTDENIGECETVFVALYPKDAINFLESKAKLINKNALVIDTCGTKRKVCEKGFESAEKYGFTFAGGHPMAGVQFSGIKYSRADMFEDASMIIVPKAYDDITLFERIKKALEPLKLRKITITTAEEHDKIIAYTSQLAHVVSSAYIKSPTSKKQNGFCGGSFRDMTRVATLNANMWTQLFLENKENLSTEIGNIIEELAKFKKAIDDDNDEYLYSLLCEGNKCKQESEENNK